MKKSKAVAADIAVVFLMIFLIYAGVRYFSDRSYTLISALAAVLACIPFYITYDARKKGVTEIVLVSVMISLTVAGRIIFVAVPFFKPVTALVIITGFYLGSECGFVTGSVSAFISNMFLAQGPWTPFQMLVWGLIGLSAGLFRNTKLTDSRIFIIIYAVISGIFYSAAMDIWTVVSADGLFEPDKYKAAVIASLPVMLIYIISDLFFLLVLNKPMKKRFIRIRRKYEI